MFKLIDVFGRLIENLQLSQARFLLFSNLLLLLINKGHKKGADKVSFN